MTSLVQSSNPFVVIAEDDPEDQEFMGLAINKLQRQVKYRFTDNGMSLLTYLGSLKKEEMPCLIVIDLNMPFLNGFQTLDELGKKPEFKTIPKVIFTTSASEEDRQLCLAKGASDFVVKPEKLSEIVKKMQQMLGFCDGSSVN